MHHNASAKYKTGNLREAGMMQQTACKGRHAREERDMHMQRWTENRVMLNRLKGLKVKQSREMLQKPHQN